MTVNFLIAGAQKCGTTALFSFLADHPQISFGRVKELHYFDDESIDWHNPDYDALHRQYADQLPGQLRGDATPVVLYWPPSMARIHRYNPEMRLIVMLRDPVERAYSQWRMETLLGNDTLSFSYAIRGGRGRLRDCPELSPAQRVFSYVERGFYAAQIDRVLDLFPRHQLLLLDQASLGTAHHATLDRICDFLGIERFADYPENRSVFSNAGASTPPISGADRAYLREVFADDLGILARRHGLRLGDLQHQP